MVSCLGAVVIDNMFNRDERGLNEKKQKMRLNFKKISAIATSALMVGMTAGIAAAATFPAPYVESGVGDAAVVYGTGQGAADLAAATSLNTHLSELVTSTDGTVTVGGDEGDNVKLERSADKFNLGDTATSVFVTSISKSHLSSLLADNTYKDADNDEFKYTQKIDLGSWSLTAFRDTDYSNEAAVGVQLTSGTTVLNYTLDFTRDPTFTAAKMENTNLVIMGKEYFILDILEDKITLLDSAKTITIQEGETQTIDVNGKSYTISPSIFGSAEVKIDVNGEVTSSLSAGQTYKLDDGTYVGVKELVIQNYAGGQKLAEVSIGSGKLILDDSNEVELNDETISGLYAHCSNSSVLNKIVLEWKTDDKEFITTESSLTMPGFDNIKIAMTAMNYPNEEVIKVENDGSDSIRLTAPIKSGTANFNLIYGNSTQILGLGKDATNKLVTSSGAALTFNETAGDKWFVTSWNTSTEGESYLLSAKVVTKDNANRTSIKDEVTGETICSDLVNTSTCTVGNSVLTVYSTYRLGSDKWVTFNVSSGGSFDTLYTAEGMAITLPFISTASNGNATMVNGELFLGATNASEAGLGHNATSWYLYLSEEDKNSALAAGNTSRFTISRNSDNKLHVSAVGTTGSEMRVGDSDKYEYYMVSDLATRVLHDRSGNQYNVVVTYAGDQAYADVYVSESSAVTTGTSGVGSVILKDTETAQYDDKNVIVVGGSCINSAAAALVGGALCGEDWKAETSVGAGQFLIQGYTGSTVTTKHAMLVAGYEAPDTNTAVTFLTNNANAVDTNAKYIGTTSTATATIVN